MKIASVRFAPPRKPRRKDERCDRGWARWRQIQEEKDKTKKNPSDIFVTG